MVGEARLARRRPRAAADQPGGRDRVVRRAEGPPGDQPAAVVAPGDAVDARHLQRLLSGQRRQDARQAPREHRLADPRRALEEQVVTARRRDLHGVHGLGLAGDVAEVGASCGLGLPQPRAPGARRARSPSSSSTASRRPAAGTTSSPSTSAASADDSPGRSGRRARRAARLPPRPASPGPARISPPRESSPWTAQDSRRASETCPLAARTPRASARSKPGPILRRYAGARLAVMRPFGKSKPELRMADRTRSRASRTAVSARPTMRNAGRPGAHVDLDRDAAGVEPVDGEGGDASEHAADGRTPAVTRHDARFAQAWPRRQRSAHVPPPSAPVASPPCPTTPDIGSAAPARTSPPRTWCVSATSDRAQSPDPLRRARPRGFDGETLVFCEVKTRRAGPSASRGTPWARASEAGAHDGRGLAGRDDRPALLGRAALRRDRRRVRRVGKLLALDHVQDAF